MPINLSSFKSNPANYLNEISFQGVKGAEFCVAGMPSGVELHDTQPTPGTLTVKDSAGKYSDRRTPELKKYKNKPVTYYLNLHNNSFSNSESSPGSSITGYYLDWAANKTYYMQLGSTADFFLTARLSGCGVIINGTRTNPTVFHSNIQTGGLLTEPTSLDPEENKNFEKQRLDLFSTYYYCVVEALEARQLVDISQDLQLFAPALYQKYRGQNASVFGLKNDNNEWTFYYNMQGMKDGKIVNVTNEIWPNKQKPTVLTD